MNKPKQAGMFTTGQDLPLFSGAVQTAPTSKPVQAERSNSQPKLPCLCRLCLDTGSVDGHYCTCEAGISLRLKHPLINRYTGKPFNS